MKFKLSFRLVVTVASIVMAILFGLMRIADPEIVQVFRCRIFCCLMIKETENRQPVVNPADNWVLKLICGHGVYSQKN